MTEMMIGEDLGAEVEKLTGLKNLTSITLRIAVNEPVVLTVEQIADLETGERIKRFLHFLAEHKTAMVDEEDDTEELIRQLEEMVR